MTNPFYGQSLFIWKVKSCTGGAEANTAAGRGYLESVMQRTGVRTAWVKVADGVNEYQLTPTPSGGYADDIRAPLFAAFAAAGRPKIGWQYLYGENPEREADKAVEVIHRYGLEGYVLDPEVEYKAAGAAVAARFMERLRDGAPGVPVALCTYRYPSLHGDFPWEGFLDFMDAAAGDVHAPQVYWMGDYSVGGPGIQLARSVTELKALKALPVVPVGSCYGAQVGSRYWEATAAQLMSFVNKAYELGLPGLSWWSWDDLQKRDVADPDDTGRLGWWPAIKAAGAKWPADGQPDGPNAGDLDGVGPALQAAAADFRRAAGAALETYTAAMNAAQTALNQALEAAYKVKG